MLLLVHYLICDKLWPRGTDQLHGFHNTDFSPHLLHFFDDTSSNKYTTVVTTIPWSRNKESVKNVLNVYDGHFMPYLS